MARKLPQFKSYRKSLRNNQVSVEENGLHQHPEAREGNN